MFWGGKIKDMDGKTYPFRDTIQLDERFEVIYWHNGDHSEKIYQLCQKSYTDRSDIKGSEYWFVRAQFRYTNELIKYLSDFDFEQIVI